MASKGFLENIRHDLPASIVVFCVAMPLCLGIALASGAPLFMIPLASLACILFVVGYKLAKPALFKTMYQIFNIPALEPLRSVNKVHAAEGHELTHNSKN